MTEETQDQEQAANGETQHSFAFESTDVQDGKLFGQFASMGEVRDALVRAQGGAPETPEEQFKANQDDTEGASSGGLRIPEAPEAAAASAGLSEADLQPFFKEYETAGGLTEESYTALEGKGIPRMMVDAYIDGQIARRDRDAQKVYEAIGGQEVANKALAWAQKNLSPERQKAFNDALGSSNADAAAMLMKGLVAESGVARNGVSPSAVPAMGANPFPSKTAMHDAFSDPRYKKSAEFRAEVERRVQASYTAGTI